VKLSVLENDSEAVGVGGGVTVTELVAVVLRVSENVAVGVEERDSVRERLAVCVTLSDVLIDSVTETDGVCVGGGVSVEDILIVPDADRLSLTDSGRVIDIVCVVLFDSDSVVEEL
jgi:hypothetical protein